MASMMKCTLLSGESRYRVRVRLRGRAASKTFRKKALAERWAAKQERLILLNDLDAVEQSTVRTLAEAVERYARENLPQKSLNTSKQQHQQLQWWLAQLGDVPLATITTPRVSLAKGVLFRTSSAGTVNNYLAALSHLFTTAVKEWQWAEKNPVTNVQKMRAPRGRDRWLSDAEREALLFYCRTSRSCHLYAIVVLALSTAPRKQELRTIRLDQVDIERRRIYLDDTKNGDRRPLILFGEALRIMADIIRNKRPGQIYCFPSPETERRPIDFRYSWEQALEKAEIANFCFHDLRHSAASYLARQGATLPEIAEILGHKTFAMVKRYAHLTDSHTEKVVARMNQAIF